MFDAWQAQQRAQKDQERKAKTDAANALQGYRRTGLTEEETKLAALREQERLQKLNAEQQLRGYRSQLTEDEAKLAAQKQEELRKKHEYEDQLRKVSAARNDSAGLMENSGVVSALAAGYSSPHKVQPPMPMVTKASPAQPNLSPAITSDPSHAIPAIAPATVRGEGLLDTPETSEVAPSTASTTETAPLPPPPASATRSPKVRSPKVPSSEGSHSPKVYHSSVKFMFGILTAGDVGDSFPQNRSKLIEGYLARADQIAKSVTADNNYSSSSFESISLSMAYPVAGSVQKDKTRKDTNRIMVTVTISFSAPDRSTSTDFKAQVISRVRSAISAGKFTKLDR